MPASYIDFVEERLELGYHYGCVGGYQFKTDIIENGESLEQRNALWWQPLGRWQLGERALLDSDFENIKEVEYLRDFHAARQGSLQGFRFKDWSDYYITNQYLWTTDGVARQFQLYKTYTAGSESYRRPITKPVPGTVKIYLDGLQITYPLVNYTNGLISFSVPPAPGQILTVDFEFDIPVRFEADKIEWTLRAIQLQDGATLHKLGSVFVKEVRIDLDLEWYRFDPIPQVISQPLDLGIILDTSETITFDTRTESLASGYSSHQSYNTGRTVLKLPTFRFNQQQLNAILDYFWVAKGRLVTFFLTLNNRTIEVRFNSDLLSVKFIVTDDLDSLYDVNLEFVYLGILLQNISSRVVTVLDLPGDDFNDDSQYQHIVESVNDVILEENGFKISHPSSQYLEVLNSSVFALQPEYWSLEFDFKMPIINDFTPINFFSIYNNRSDFLLNVQLLFDGGRRFHSEINTLYNGSLQLETFTRNTPNSNFQSSYVNFKVEYKYIRDASGNDIPTLEYYYNGASLGSRQLLGTFVRSIANPAIGKEISSSNQPFFYIKNIKFLNTI